MVPRLPLGTLLVTRPFFLSPPRRTRHRTWLKPWVIVATPSLTLKCFVSIRLGMETPSFNHTHWTARRQTPTLANIAWTINRNYVRMGLTEIPSATGSLPPAPETNDAKLYQNLPIRCRMIRVTPKLAPGVTLGVDPTTDLFLDQKGLRYSPNDAAWGLSDNEYARVNTRNYTVLGDVKFTLGQPLTAAWTNDYIDEPSNFMGWRQDLTIPNKPSVKRLRTSHQLTAKKGGQCHYVAGSAGTTDEVAVATSGQRREYIFMHFWYECGDGSVSAGGTLPTLVPAGTVPGIDALKVHFRVESRFKEE
uniref:Uncharacterized protein n=1 Tax=uncultured marine virus TaxID=186617 RepID=S4TEM6_9VIRU|nr:hypothetical protein [uncultured marine virus]